MKSCLIEDTLIRAAEVRVHVRASGSPWETRGKRGRSGLLGYRELAAAGKGFSTKS